MLRNVVGRSCAFLVLASDLQLEVLLVPYYIFSHAASTSFLVWALILMLAKSISY